MNISTATTYYTLTTENYERLCEERLPSNVTDVFIREDVLELPIQKYREIFNINDNESLNKVNVTLPDSHIPCGLLPANKNIQLEESDDRTVKYEQSGKIMSLMNGRTQYTIHNLIECGISYYEKLWDILLASTTISSGYHYSYVSPFMTAAVVNERLLDFVYMMVMMADPTVIKN